MNNCSAISHWLGKPEVSHSTHSFDDAIIDEYLLLIIVDSEQYFPSSVENEWFSVSVLPDAVVLCVLMLARAFGLGLTRCVFSFLRGDQEVQFAR